eukprot:2122131-Pleurochrysis_carterae.AAC.2
MYTYVYTHRHFLYTRALTLTRTHAHIFLHASTRTRTTAYVHSGFQGTSKANTYTTSNCACTDALARAHSREALRARAHERVSTRSISRAHAPPSTASSPINLSVYTSGFRGTS